MASQRRTVSVSLPLALAERMEAHAGTEGVTLSDVLRWAIEAYDKTLLASIPAPHGGFPWQAT
jgi:predicted DNA-binding protein